MENTEGRAGCAFAHGLSFYVETKKHRLLLDLGPSAETLTNAERLGVDLSAVDTVILSHGHYDHSGGIPAFVKCNDRAVIYMQASAAADYFADDGETAPVRYRYIGIDKTIPTLPQTRFVRGDLEIDEELGLFTVKERSHKLPFTNRRLLVRVGEGYQRDNFGHEQFLVIRQDGKLILMSGCAHNGILSILDAFREKYGRAPDLVVSGFHLMKKTPYAEEELREIGEIAGELRKYPTRFITCHCTGEAAYERMKSIMGEQLAYVHSGEELSGIGEIE